jgi:hypothetical protein
MAAGCLPVGNIVSPEIQSVMAVFLTQKWKRPGKKGVRDLPFQSMNVSIPDHDLSCRLYEKYQSVPASLLFRRP